MNVWLQKRTHSKKAKIATLVENQRLLEEYSSFPDDTPSFVPMVEKIYENFLGFEMVSVQPMLGPCSMVNFMNFKYESDTGKISLHEEGREAVAHSRKFKVQQGLDEDETARLVREEITREIINDLRNNAGTIQSIPADSSAEEIRIRIHQVSEGIYRKTCISKATWVLMHPETAEKLSHGFTREFFHWNTDGILSMGVFDKWNLITDSLFPDNQILLGAYGGGYASGYAYCPYVPITKTPVIIFEDFCPRPGYLHRYAKRLDHSGAKFYGRIVLSK